MGFIQSYKKKKEVRELDELFRISLKSKHIRKDNLKDEILKQIEMQTKDGQEGYKPYFSIGTGRLHLTRPAKYNPLADYSGLPKEQIVSRDRITTGVPGLDPIMGGGFRRNTVNLIGGGTGSGKSILCMQFLVDGIEKCNENGIFISFEENKDKILDDFRIFNWDLEKKLKEHKLEILYFTPEQVDRVVESGGGIVRDVIEQIGAKRVIIDSLTAYMLLFKTDLDKRRGVLDLFDSLHRWNITALMTSEQEPDPDKHASTIMEFEVDSVILMYYLRKVNVRERSIEVFKMRATKHSSKISPMVIDSEGITVFPDEAVF